MMPGHDEVWFVLVINKAILTNFFYEYLVIRNMYCTFNVWIYAILGVCFLYSRLTLLFNYLTTQVNQIIKLSGFTKSLDLPR